MKSYADVTAAASQRPRRRRVVAVVLSALLLAVAWQWLPARGGGANAQDGEWLTLAPEPLLHRLTLQGQLLPQRSVDIVAAADGVLASLDVALGDRVAAGQRLAQIRSTDLAVQLSEAEAAALRARVEAESQRTPERSGEFRAAARRVGEADKAAQVAASRAADTLTLYDKGIVARMELDQSRQEADAARGQAEQAREDLGNLRRKWGTDQLQALALETAARETRLKQLRRRQGQLLLDAPIGGVVLYPAPQEAPGGAPARAVKAGAPVSAGQVLMTIGATDAYLVRGNISEFDVRWLRPGLPATVRLTTLPEVALAAQVVRVASQAQVKGGGGESSGVAEFEVQVQLPAPGQTLPAEVLASLRIGIGAEVTIETKDAASQIVLPLSALQWGSNGEAQVRVRTARGAEMRGVLIAGTQVDRVAVRGGVGAGEAVWVPATHGKDGPGAGRRWLDGVLGRDAGP